MDRHGGVQTHVRDLSDWIVRQGHHAQIVSAKGTDGLGFGRVRIVRLHGTVFEICRASAQDLQGIVSQIKSEGVSLLHLHNPWTPSLSMQVVRATGLPFVTTYHATVPPARLHDPMSIYIRARAASIARKARAVVVPSRAASATWGNARFKRVVIAPCVNLSPWRNAAREPNKIGAQMTILYLGRFEDRKGISTLLDAWRMVGSHRTDWRLILAGDSSAPNNLPKKVSVRGPMSDADARTLVAQADVLVVPAPYGESFGLVLAEGMASQTAVLAADTPAFREVMGDKLARSNLFAPYSATELAALLLQLADAPEQRTRLAIEGQARANIADVETVGPDYLTLYEKALNT
jgi:phosphatidylinositol alpha-mannosyltransferase